MDIWQLSSKIFVTWNKKNAAKNQGNKLIEIHVRCESTTCPLCLLYTIENLATRKFHHNIINES